MRDAYREVYIMKEVACDNYAGFQSAVAGWSQISKVTYVDQHLTGSALNRVITVQYTMLN